MKRSGTTKFLVCTTVLFISIYGVFHGFYGSSFIVNKQNLPISILSSYVLTKNVESVILLPRSDEIKAQICVRKQSIFQQPKYVRHNIFTFIFEAVSLPNLWRER